MEPAELDKFAQRIVEDGATNWPHDSVPVQWVKLIVHVIGEVKKLEEANQRRRETFNP